MKFVLKRKGRWGYVARPGSKSSYCVSIDSARRFDTREEAEADRCVESEYIVEVKA